MKRIGNWKYVFSRLLGGGTSAIRLSSGLIRIFVPKLDQHPFYDIISVDIFGTLIQRTSDEHYARRMSAFKTVEIAQQRGLTPPCDAIALRAVAEKRIFEKLKRVDGVTEFSNSNIIEEMLKMLGAGDWAVDASHTLARWELQQEIENTRPQPELVHWIRTWKANGKKIIAVSDTRYSAKEILMLFSAHKITEISEIYSSLDFGATKFNGMLFDIVSKREGVSAKNILHIGDNVLSDILSGAQRGLNVRWVRYPTRGLMLPSTHLKEKSDFFDIGYKTLGPLVVGFVRMLFEQAKSDEVNHLLFVSRDGYLPLKVAEILSARSSTGELPTIDYVYLSRRVVASSSVDFLFAKDDPACLNRLLQDIRTLRGGSNLIVRFKNYIGISDEIMFAQTSRLNLYSGTEDELRLLLSDRIAMDTFVSATRQCRDVLFEYLEQEKVFSEDSAFVDIGWRGTIHNTLNMMAVSRSRDFAKAYYLGYWGANENLRDQKNVTGLICDWRRSRNIVEGSAFHCAFLLEAIFRSDEGMVTGFEKNEDDVVVPIKIITGYGRDAEIASEQAKIEIQNGVLKYAEWFAKNHEMISPDVETTRRAAQLQLFKLAFFPTRRERKMGSAFVHSEITDDDWSASLILHPGKGIKGWFAGVRSPWKGGYFRANGGLLAAGMYCLLEAVLAYISIEHKLTLRRWLFRANE